MSAFNPPSGSGGGLSPEDLAALVEDGELDASQAAQAAAIGTAIATARDAVNTHTDDALAAQTTAINAHTTTRVNSLQMLQQGQFTNRFPTGTALTGYYPVAPSGWAFADGGIVQGYDRRDQVSTASASPGSYSPRYSALKFQAEYGDSPAIVWRQIQGGVAACMGPDYVELRRPTPAWSGPIYVGAPDVHVDAVSIHGVCFESAADFWVLWKDASGDYHLSACAYDSETEALSTTRTLALTVDGAVGQVFDWDLYIAGGGQLVLLRSGASIIEDTLATATVTAVDPTNAGAWRNIFQYASEVLAVHSDGVVSKLLFSTRSGPESAVGELHTATIEFDVDNLWSITSIVASGYAAEMHEESAPDGQYFHTAGCAVWAGGTTGFIFADIDGLHSISATGAYKQLAGAHPRMRDAYGYPVGLVLHSDWLNEPSGYFYAYALDRRAEGGVWSRVAEGVVRLGTMLSRFQRTIVRLSGTE